MLNKFPPLNKGRVREGLKGKDKFGLLLQFTSPSPLLIKEGVKHGERNFLKHKSPVMLNKFPPLNKGRVREGLKGKDKFGLLLQFTSPSPLLIKEGVKHGERNFLKNKSPVLMWSRAFL
ncbi:MAG: hypothetical protein JST55_00830 [Bacteroidetes bacterium]|nr:hypothetical protein [Bacteroidota bacterium]